MFHLKRYRRILLVLLLIVILMYEMKFFHRSVTRIIYKSKYDSKSLIKQPISKEVNFDTSLIKYIPHETLFQTYKSVSVENAGVVNWEKQAYVFYATSPQRLLGVLVNVHQLKKLKTKAKIVVIYTSNNPMNEYHKRTEAWNLDYDKLQADNELPKEPLLDILSSKYGAIIKIFPSLYNINSNPGEYWGDSFTKLHIWHMLEFERIVYLDCDGFIRKNLDLLFLTPPSLLAAPIEYDHVPRKRESSSIFSAFTSKSNVIPTPLEHALMLKDMFNNIIANELSFDQTFYEKLYNALPDVNGAMDLGEQYDSDWQMKLGSYLMVCTPNLAVWDWIKSRMLHLDKKSWDMEFVNDIWNLRGLVDTKSNVFKVNDELSIPSLIILPHAPYALLSGEFRKTLHEHNAYLTPPPYIGFHGDPTFDKISLRELQRNYDIEIETVEDAWSEFRDIGVWDWAWRFDRNGKYVKADITNEDEKEVKQKSKLKKRLVSDKLDKQVDGNEKEKFEEYEVFYIGMGLEAYGWDPKKIHDTSFYIHWSDYPLSKPWDVLTMAQLDEIDWDKLEIWSSFLDLDADSHEPQFSGTMDQMVRSSFELCSFSRGAEDLFGKTVCKDSVIEWKNLYVEYWEVLNELK